MELANTVAGTRRIEMEISFCTGVSYVLWCACEFSGVMFSKVDVLMATSLSMESLRLYTLLSSRARNALFGLIDIYLF